MHTRTAVLILCATLLGAAPCLAQVRITGAISGTVTDTSDAVIPGAAVQLRDEGTGITKETITSDLPRRGSWRWRACCRGGPWVRNGSLNKDFEGPGTASLRLHATVTNLLNHPVWGAPSWNGNPNITDTTFGQVTAPLGGAYGAREMFIRTEIRF